ncbi:MAG: hypothetical protein MI741_11175, partial [Rhodospirillales bacterium]|nr:hypothetical protein [Rhodospirillales bacterium]
FANLFHGMFGSGLKRPFSRQSLEDFVGPAWTKVIVSVPVITGIAWLCLWVAARIFDMPHSEDPFVWIRDIFGVE